MSEPVHTSETPATDVPEQQPTTPEPTEEVIPGAEHLGDPGQRALDHLKAQRNQIREERDALKARLKEIEDRDLSELQRAQRDAEEARARLQEIEREAVRNRVALAKGLPADVAAILSGANEDELAAHADRLIAWRSNQTPPAPRPDPSQGPRPTSPDQEADLQYQEFARHLFPGA